MRPGSKKSNLTPGDCVETAGQSQSQSGRSAFEREGTRDDKVTGSHESLAASWRGTALRKASSRQNEARQFCHLHNGGRSAMNPSVESVEPPRYDERGSADLSRNQSRTMPDVGRTTTPFAAIATKKPSGNQQTVEMIQRAEFARFEPRNAKRRSAVRKDRVNLHPLKIVGRKQGPAEREGITAQRLRLS